MSGASTCRWCGTAMAASRQPKRFCCSAHRGSFHEACRRFGERLFEEGAVSIEQLRGETINSDTAHEPLTATSGATASPDKGDDHRE